MAAIAMHETPPAPDRPPHARMAPRRRRRLARAPAEAREAPPTPVQISVVAYDAGGAREHSAPTAADAIQHAREGAVTWIDVQGLDPAVLAGLAERFDLHPLALEDAAAVPQRAKVERYDAHLFMVLHLVRGTHEIEDEQVSIFVGPGWVLTIQERAGSDAFAAVRDAIRQGRGRVRAASADYLAYLLVDAVVDGYFPILDASGDRAEVLEDDAIAHPTEGTLVRIQRLRHDVLLLRRAVWPLREAIAVLQRDESGLIAAETKVFLRDAHDHAVQALEVVEVLREGVASLMEVYLSAQNQRLNQVMKVLTVIATFFIPLTFIASIYGMNFEIMPELHWRHGYLWALGLMAACATTMAVYFKRKEWW